MFLGDQVLGADLPFYAQANDTAGSAVDAVPDTCDYDIYANENGVAVASGTMTHLDAGALGNYSETITLSGPTFAVNTWYEIRMYPTGTIDGETPAYIHTFRILPSIGERCWDETIVGHAHAQTFGALQYFFGNWINQVVADGANSPTTFRTDYGAAFEGQLLGKILYISSGANAGSARIITAYNPGTNFVTVAPALPFTPPAGTIIPTITIPTFFDHQAEVNADAVWDEALAGHLAAGSTGEALDDTVKGTLAGIADAVWDALKASHQGPTIMGNMAEDLDAMQVRVEEA